MNLDLEAIKEVYETSDMESEAYQSIQEKLYDEKQLLDAQFMYTLVYENLHIT